MKNGRINERNAGHWSLDGEPKTRRAKPKSNALTDEDRVILLAIVGKVIDCMAFDPEISERGHLHPEATFTDGGRFLLSMTRAQFEALGEIYEKLER